MCCVPEPVLRIRFELGVTSLIKERLESDSLLRNLGDRSCAHTVL
jgi:hypothetical protein